MSSLTRQEAVEATAAEVAEAEAAEAAEEGGLPHGWVAVEDESGRTYYWHEDTDATRWERPSEAVTGGAADAGEAQEADEAEKAEEAEEEKDAVAVGREEEEEEEEEEEVEVVEVVVSVMVSAFRFPKGIAVAARTFFVRVARAACSIFSNSGTPRAAPSAAAAAPVLATGAPASSAF